MRLPLWLAFLCLGVIYVVWGWSDDISDFQGDSSVYMLAARYFSPFWPSSPIFSESANGMAYPPLFPLLIGLLGGSMLAGHLLVIVSLLAAVLCLYAWLRIEGLGVGASGAACLVFALMPGTYLQALNIWTENLYLFLSLLAIALEIRAETEGANRPSFWWMTATAIASASLVRAAALPLLAAFIIRVAIMRPRHWRLLISAACAPFFLWAFWQKLHLPAANGYAAQWMASYGHDPADLLLRQVRTEAILVLRSWSQAWLGDAAGATFYFLSLIAGCLGILGWLPRLIKLRLDAIYVALYGALLLVWPFPAEARRLSYVLIPFVLGYGLLPLNSMSKARSESSKTLLQTLWLGALTITILPSLMLTLHRFNAPLSPDIAAARHIEDWYQDDRNQAANSAHSFALIIADLRHIGSLVPDDACIFSIKPSVVSLYSGRRSYIPPRISVNDNEFERGIARCKYAYVLAYVSPSFGEAYYPLRRLSTRASPLSVAEENDGTTKRTFSALVEISTP